MTFLFRFFLFMEATFRFYHKSIGVDHQLNVINRNGWNFSTKQITWYCKFIHDFVMRWESQILWSAESTFRIKLPQKTPVQLKPKVSNYIWQSCVSHSIVEYFGVNQRALIELCKFKHCYSFNETYKIVRWNCRSSFSR